jgi:hypothetical protein
VFQPVRMTGNRAARDGCTTPVYYRIYAFVKM